MDTKTLVQNIATILADGEETFKWHPNGPDYVDGQVGIYYGQIAESPDRGIGITMYQTDDEVDPEGIALRRVQIRCRGNAGSPASADDIADKAFAILHMMTRRLGVNLAYRVSSIQMGKDESGRSERADNYQLIIDN